MYSSNLMAFCLACFLSGCILQVDTLSDALTSAESASSDSADCIAQPHILPESVRSTSYDWTAYCEGNLKSLNYFAQLDFPFYALDSLSDDDFAKHLFDEGYYLMFTPCDSVLFSRILIPGLGYNRYISLQPAGRFTSVFVQHSGDCRNYAVLYVFDSLLNVTDHILLLDHSCPTPIEDVLAGNKWVTYADEFSAVAFHDSIIRHYRTIVCTLRDRKTACVSQDTGYHKVIDYHLNEAGRFEVVDSTGWQKQYTFALPDAP